MMKKKILYLVPIIMILMLSVLLTACDEGTGGGSETPAHEVHAYGEWTLIKEATCLENGLRERACECGEKESESLPKLAHEEVVDEAVAPTCTQSGKTKGMHCTVCNTVTVEQQEVAAKGHAELTFPATAPGCIKEGKTEGKYCSVCKVTTVPQQTIPAIGHDIVTIEDVAPTCTQRGFTEGKGCSKCSYVEVEPQIIPAIGHKSTIDPGVPPTCTETGLTEGIYCEVCNEVIEEKTTLPATGHTEVVDAAVPPTCTKTGLTEGKHCSVCGFVIEAQKIVPTAEHTIVIDKAVPPTCTEDGLTEGSHCSVCNAVIAVQIIDPFTGHTEVTAEAVAPTCTQTGLTEGTYCSSCGEEFVKQEIIPIVPHEITVTFSQSQLKAECSGCGHSESYDIEIADSEKYGLNQFRKNANGDLSKAYMDLMDIAAAFEDSKTDVTKDDGIYPIGKIKFSNYDLTFEEVISVWKIFYIENPQFYWLSNTVSFDDDHLILCVDGDYAKYSERERYDGLIEEMLIGAVKAVNFADADLDIVYALHEYIIMNNQYAYIEGTSSPETAAWAHNMVGFAEKGKGVCEAYAKTFLYFSYIFDVENIIVTGQSYEPHAWNLVKIDGVWYGFDLTWNDNGEEKIYFNYFGRSGEMMDKDHTPDLPSSTSIDYLYALPELSGKDIELVRLLKDGADMGLRLSIDDTFSSMDDPDAEYTVELFNYHFKGVNFISPPAFVYRIGTDVPEVSEVTLEGHMNKVMNGNFFTVTTVQFTDNISLGSDLTIKSIGMITDEFTLDVNGHYLILGGFYNFVSGDVSDSGDGGVIVNTDPESLEIPEINAKVNVSNFKVNTDVKIRNDTTIKNLYLTSVLEYVAFLDKANTIKFENIHLFSGILSILSESKDTEITIGNILNPKDTKTEFGIRLSFGDIEDYPHVSFVGTTDFRIDMRISGYKTSLFIDIATGDVIEMINYEVSPWDMSDLILLNTSKDVWKITDLCFVRMDTFSSSSVSSLCIIDENGNVKMNVAPPDENGFVISGTTLIGYDGPGGTVRIPEGIRVIAKDCFNADLSIYTVILPSTLTKIESNAFSNCYKLVEVVNRSYLSVVCGATTHGGVARHAFAVLTAEDSKVETTNDGFVFYKGEKNYLIDYIGNAETVILPETSFKYAIGDYAFYNNDDMKEVELNSCVTGIGESAFKGCDMLGSIYIPSSVEYLDEESFWSCAERLKSITFDRDSKVTKLPRCVFMACFRMKYIVLPESITAIDPGAFTDASAMDAIYYYGDEASWNKIKFADDFEFGGTVYFYSETAPTGTGNYWHMVNGTPVPWN